MQFNSFERKTDILPMGLFFSSSSIQWRLEAAARSLVDLKEEAALPQPSLGSEHLCPLSEASSDTQLAPLD